MPAPRISLESHPPERRRRAPVTLYGTCCCCCCCCCLHTVGGIVGAAVGSQPVAGARRERGDHRLPDVDLTPVAPRGPGITRGRTDLTAGIDPAGELEHEYDDEVFDVRQPSRLSVIAWFWYGTLILSLLILLGAPILYRGGRESIMIAAFILIMCFPAVQLLSALLVAIGLAFSSQPGKDRQLWQIGKIILGLVLGTIAGLGVMLLVALPCLMK